MQEKHIICSIHNQPAKLYNNNHGKLIGVECRHCDLLLTSATLELRWEEEMYRHNKKNSPRHTGPSPHAHITFPQPFTVLPNY